MRTFSKFKQLFQIDEPESGSRKPESVGYGVLSSGEKNYSVRQMYMNFFQPRKSAPEAALYGLQGRSLRPKKQADEPTFLSDVYNRCTRAKKWQTDGCLSGRSLRPKKWQDEPTFLSEVYNRCTRAKKWQTDGCLSGRSMVEMIGVLAIIGVLSVSAITGYSKAMFKYKMNKTIEIFNSIAQNLIDPPKEKFSLLQNLALAYRLGIISKDTCPPRPDASHAVCLLPKAELLLAVNNKLPSGKVRGEIFVYFKDSDRKDACVSFLSYHWEDLLPSYNYVEIEGKKGDTLRKKYNLVDINNACNDACESECTLHFVLTAK